MKRFLNFGTAYKAVMVGVLVGGMVTACQNGDNFVNSLAQQESKTTTGSANPPKQFSDSQQIANILKMLRAQQSLVVAPKSKESGTIHGVNGASGSISGIAAVSGGSLTFTGNVSGVETSNMVTAGMRAMVEFENAYGQTLAIWEYSDGCGFRNMNSLEMAQGGYALAAPPLYVPTNVTRIRISLAVWDQTDPSTHYKFLDYQVVNL